jgi:transposase InsO family protein
MSPEESLTVNQEASPTVSPEVNPTVSPDINPTVNPKVNPTARPTSLLDISHIESRLHGAIHQGRDELISMLQQYGSERTDLIMMVRDLQANDVRLLNDIEDEQQQVLQDIIALELDEQRIHDVELSQLNDDILHHINSGIDEIITSIDHVDSDDDDSGRDWYQDQTQLSTNNLHEDTDSELSPEELITEIIANTNMSDIDDWGPEAIALMVANPVFTILCEAHYNALVYFADGTHRVFLRSEVDEASLQIANLSMKDSTLREVPHSASDSMPIENFNEDDCSDNTDTEDGAQEVVGLIQSNMKLLALLSCQSNTIARLRARNTRLRNRIQVMTTHMADMRASTSTSSPRATPTDQAHVLVDTQTDASLFVAPNRTPVTQADHLYPPEIKSKLVTQLAKIKSMKACSQEELWMYYDSGASRSVISTTSPIRTHLHEVQPTYGSCSIGDGTPLQYIEKGNVKDNMEVTVVQGLKYDLFSSVHAAKQGLSSVIDFDLQTGANNSYTIDKLTGAITPLVERGKGILELPLHAMLPPGSCFTVIPMKSPLPEALPPHVVSMFWHCYDDVTFDPTNRDNNKTDYALFTFDIIKSLSERERDFLIHARMGHLPRKKILQMIKNGTTGITDYSGKFKELCKPCMQAKQRAENHGHEHKRHPNGRPGEHLHSDLATLSTLDLKGNKYVLTVVDEISHEVVIGLLKRKTADDVYRVCKQIQMAIAARTGTKLLTWQFDRGTEFLNSTFEKWLKLELGVTQRFSNIEHPWENGMAERSFQTLFSLSRSLLKHADLPDRLWGKAILHSVYITNRSPAAALGGIAPLQFRTKLPIDLSHLRVFGSPAQIFVRATIRNDTKLSDRSVSGTFVGMSDKGNGFIFLIEKSDELVEIDSKDAKFNETFADCRARQGKLMKANYINPDLTEEKNASDDDKDVEDEQHQKGRQRRITTPRKFLLPGTGTKPSEVNIRQQQYANLCLDDLMEDNSGSILLLDCMEAQLDDEAILTKELELLTACALDYELNEILTPAIKDANTVNLSIPDPKSQSEIDRMDPKDAIRFNDATIAEVKGMKGKNVFVHATIDELPPGTKIYQSVVNWTSKTNLGVYVKTKCRICFGGHRYDKSYSDTFAPTVNFCTVLVIICLSAMFGWFMGSLDYSQAYLNANIDEICVMRAPISVREYNPQGKEYYWLLRKAIYGHPKASRLWAECLHRKLVELGYIQFLTDQCVYGRWTNWDSNAIQGNTIPDGSSFIFLLIHSDDIIIASHSENIMIAAKAELLQAFEGTDNGKLSSFCGVEVRTSENQVSLSMEYYWNKLMTKFNVKENEVENAPLKSKILRSECPAEPDDKMKTSYLQIIGSIIYGYTHCRLDLAFPVNMLTRIMHSPAEKHYDLLRKLLHYINGTKNWTLNFYKDATVFYGMDFVFYCNVDAAHADDDETHRSTGGWFFWLRKGQGAVAAKSSQTKDIPLSSTESETIWGSNAAMQGAFLKQFLDETRLFKSATFEIHEDSQPMINAQKRNVSQSRFKHMRTKHHYIRKLIFDGWCKLIKIQSKMNTADMATKILPASTVSIFSKIVLGLQDSLLYFSESDD